MSRSVQTVATGIVLAGAILGFGAPANADTTPDPFSFVTLHNVRRLFPAVAEVKVTGIDAPTAITVVNGEYATPHTGFTSGPGLVVNGDVVYVRHTASSGFDTSTTTMLTVGGVSAPFTTHTIKRRVLTSGQLRDFNGDGYPDMIWRNAATGDTAVWLLDDVFSVNGNFLEGHVLLEARLDWIPTHFGDFDGNGTTDIVWRNATSGEIALWLMGNGTLARGAIVMADSAWAVAHVADFDGDGTSDLLWHNATSGETAMWLMNGLQFHAGGTLIANPAWLPVHTADFNGDGRADIVWRSQMGDNVAWLMTGLNFSEGAWLPANGEYEVKFAPDLDGDGKDDLVWFKTSTLEAFGWLMDGLVPRAYGFLWNGFQLPIAVGEVNGDGKADIFYLNQGGSVWWATYDGLSMIFGDQELWPPQVPRAFADFDGNGLVEVVYFVPTGTWLRYRVLPSPPLYVTLRPPLLLIEDPSWRLH